MTGKYIVRAIIVSIKSGIRSQKEICSGYRDNGVNNTKYKQTRKEKYLAGKIFIAMLSIRVPYGPSSVGTKRDLVGF